MREIKNIKNILIFLFGIFFAISGAYSQILAPTGVSNRASSQLIYYYDQDGSPIFIENDPGFMDPGENDSTVQVTNTNDTTGVWIHVQIFRSFDPDWMDVGNGLVDGPLPPVLCDERNFVDFLTPNDTHVYDLDFTNFPKNMGETETAIGESTAIDVDGTIGFVIITPVVSESDLTAISFQHLIGTTDDDNEDFSINAMGRDAVDFTTGEIVAEGTPLDGSTNGFVVLQPDELLFSFGQDQTGGDNELDIVGIAIIDQYGSPGLLGYQVSPGATNWTSFIFDYKEDPTSCGNRPVNCFLSVGLNDNIEQDSEETNPNQGKDPDDVLCAGTETPEYPEENPDGGDSFEPEFFGWTRIFVSGLDSFESHIGLVKNDDVDGADYMYVRGERTEVEPEPMDEICDDEAMADEDEDGFANCLDTDCATAENCETGEEECADEMDNDEDGQTDCADLGCDGFAGCEFGEEVSCDDGIDNDADGAVDGDDTDCQEETTGGDGGDGGGCVVTGTVSTSSTVVNFLVLMLPFIGVFGIRRIRNRK